MKNIMLTSLVVIMLSACNAATKTADYDCEDPTKAGYSKSKYMQQQSQGKCQHIQENGGKDAQ